MSQPTRARTLEPVRGLAAAAAACSMQVSTITDKASAYGQCMLKYYQDIQPGVCAREFDAFKACVTKQVC